MKPVSRRDAAGDARSRRARIMPLLPVLLLAGLSAPARAATTGIALVIGTDLYAGQPQHTACEQTAHDVRNRLRQQGFTVEELPNASAVTLRSAIDNLATQLNGAPSGTTLIYVCAAAALDGQRLFVLPADADLRGTIRPQTDGVVMQALLNALAGTGGAVYADLGVPGGTGLEAARTLLRDRLPPGLHLALATDSGPALGALGQALAGTTVPLDASWTQLAGVLQPKPHSGGTSRLLLPTPAAPAAAPPSAAAPAIPASADAARPAGTEAAAPPSSNTSTPAAEASKASPTAGPLALHAQPHRHPDTDRPTPLASRRTLRIQAAMARQGAFSGPLDGVMDKRTLTAIRSYQAGLGDQATGVLTQPEIVRLLNPTDPSR